MAYCPRYVRQQEGIPQGSILSSLLCSLYYGHIEKEYLQSFVSPEDPSTFPDLHVSDSPDVYSLMLRFVDDTLYITTSLDYATRYAQRMAEGFPDYGCEINPTKTLVNFPLVLKGEAIKQAEYKGKPTRRSEMIKPVELR